MSGKRIERADKRMGGERGTDGCSLSRRSWKFAPGHGVRTPMEAQDAATTLWVGPEFLAEEFEDDFVYKGTFLETFFEVLDAAKFAECVLRRLVPNAGHADGITAPRHHGLQLAGDGLVYREEVVGV